MRHIKQQKYIIGDLTAYITEKINFRRLKCSLKKSDVDWKVIDYIAESVDMVIYKTRHEGNKYIY